MPEKKPRAFISYSHADRKFGAQAKVALASLGLDAFLAHDDLYVSELWRERILEELRSCEVFVPLLSANSRVSDWTSQEIGFIVSRPEVIITPISIDATIPFGFIAHIQSRRIETDGVTRDFFVEP